ncbi:MAG TPA: (2Fe-2S)-binding protein [Deltaproteobacteria bacterium]|nr:(2Fe-2S)-binding protein [Candidatus Binatota bacterium]HIL13649.1 (2Fe-2S)-binding protein [Deltaproteobacteria bacterium]
MGEGKTSRVTVEVTVNGRRQSAELEPRVTLADFLRVELGLTGTHLGCEHGVCGACTVLLDGRAVRSCIMLAVQAAGHEVTTIEALANEGELHPLQQAFVDKHGLQCGFCTPGFIMAAAELLERDSDPSEQALLETLGGQVCRCTGYEAIIESVRDAAEKLRQQGVGPLELLTAALEKKAAPSGNDTGGNDTGGNGGGE